MKLPATEEEVNAGGWVKQSMRPCRLCHRPLIFYRTLANQLMPTETVLVDGVVKIVSHFGTCPYADKFRRPKEAKPEALKTGELFT